MKWPWSRVHQPGERRDAQPFTDAITAAIQAQAGATATASSDATAALECAAGIVSRAFASAEVRDGGMAGEALRPHVLGLIGRNLIRRGESLFLVDVGGAVPTLLPAGSWDVRGDWRESSWWYRLDLFGPSGNVTRLVPSAAVVHCRYSYDPARPWLGLSPLQWARLSGRLLAETESALADESSGPRGHLIPVPNTPDEGEADDTEGDDALAGLRADVAALRGRVALVETTSAGWGEGREAAPGVGNSDWRPQRIGAHPPESLVSLRSDAAQAVLSACGVPIELASGGDGTSLREAFRRFLHVTVAPLAAIVTDELRGKLDAPGLTLNFDGLFASDLSGRARAFQSMVGAGMDAAKAAALAGLAVPD